MQTYPDPFFRRWSRRALTYSFVFIGFFALLLTAPIWLPVALIIDAFRRVELSTTRAISFVTLYLFWQVWGLVGMFVLWILHGRNYDRFMRAMFGIEFFWGHWLGVAGIRLWNMKVHLEEDYEFGKRPVILLVRHASLTDTFIPLIYACARHKQRLGFVMKRELEWDPCLDLAVNRMPHLFVVRGSGDSAREIEAIGTMMDGVGANQGVIIFPEGTRYTPAKRTRIIEKLRSSGPPDVAEWAERYKNVLPPRMGGPLALLDHAHRADIVFCAHTGLERSSTFADCFNGSLVGADVHIRFWGAHTEDLPADAEGRKQWLLEQWLKVDKYIESHRDPALAVESPPKIAALL